ncbi:MAG: AMP-binding protein [Burkholderiales bacterium]|nr:AMP-binding protein [Burkholderiales bacterium]
MNIADWIRANAQRMPGKVALRGAEGDLSYAEFEHGVAESAAVLASAGVRHGDRVAWLGLNSAAQLAMLFACARVGAIFLPLNWRLAPPEHRSMLAESAPALLLADDPFVAQTASADAVSPGLRCVALGAHIPPGWTSWRQLADAASSPSAIVAAAGGDEPVLLCYTSGSTGRPKGALLSHAALAANADASVDMHGLTADDRVLTTLPMFHVGGLNIQTTPALRTGCTVVLHPKFDPQATLEAIERERITLTVLVPAQIEALLAHPRWARTDLRSLRAISTGSTFVPPLHIKAIQARDVPLIQVWGATETCPIAACQRIPDAFACPGSAGRAAAGVELRVVDGAGAEVPAGGSGEILVRGANVMSGYWRDPEASARALREGWFHSGDRGRLDDQRRLWVDGRLKDMIISGGENVSPAEVESVLLECPDVAEAAVVGRPDARWGEVVVAVVAPRPGAALDPERLLGMFQGRLARFKQPKVMLVVDELPRTALGKVRKDDVRRLVAQRTGGKA